MTTTLPSFLELMAGLGLDDPKTSSVGENVPRTSDATTGVHRRTRSRSSSSSSNAGASENPSLTVPRHPHKAQSISSLRDLSEEPRPVAVTRRSMRYSPYGPMISSRRGSLPPEYGDQNTFTGVVRSSSTSPPGSPPQSRSRRGSMGRDNARELTISSPAISSFVRRKTPLSSPTSPTFAHIRRTPPPSSRDTLAVPTIPTIPNLLPQPALFAPEVERPRSLRSSPMLSSSQLPDISEMETLSDQPLPNGMRSLSAPGLLDEHHRRSVSPIA